MAVRFRLSGAVEAEVDGVGVDIGPARQRCVLAALAIDAGTVVPVERVVDRVWGDFPPLRVRASLHSYLTRLRRVLGEAAPIRYRSGGYVLDVDPGTVDLHSFRDLVTRAGEGVGDVDALFARAWRLWRGEPLADLDTPWVLQVRADLERVRVAAELDHTEHQLRRGRHAGLVAGLLGRVEERPFDERLVGQAVLALYRSGRQAEALDQYHRLRARLADGLGTDPGFALRELYRRVLAGESLAPEGAPPASPAPCRLPPAPVPFTGRTRELDELTAGRGTAEVRVVIGVGGVGKTWLVLHWAHRHVEDFPDGLLFVDLRGFGPTGRAMTPGAAARVLLDALGADTGELPDDPDALTALYRARISDRRMLVVLDNAADTDQVTALLPDAGACTTLITSRNRLPGLVTRRGARPVLLDVLTDTESSAVLTTALTAARRPAEEPAVADLVELCGGFPLALGVIAARIATDPRLPLSDIVTELRELGLHALGSDDPTAGLPTVLSWSLHRLSDQQGTVFALLGIAPGPDIDLPAAASLSALPVREAHAVLRALADSSLLTRVPGGRYTMHDLVRAYAATVAHDLPEPVRGTALWRVVDFYRHTAHNADRLLDPHRPPPPLDPPGPGAHPHPLLDHSSALAWMDAHHPHLLAAQHTAVAQRHHHAVWHLAWALSTFHWRRGHRQEHSAVCRAAVEASGHLPDPVVRILAHRLLGRAHAESDRHEQAVDHLQHALVLAERHHEPAQQAHTHHTLAWAWQRRGDDQRALEHARRALDLSRTLDNPIGEANALNAVGWFAARRGDHDTARAHCRAALALQRRHRYPEGEADTLDSLGWIEHAGGRHHQAVQHYRHALVLFRALGNTTRSADTLDSLAHAHVALGQHDQARATWQEALELYRAQGRDEATRVQQRLNGIGTRHQPPHDTGPTG
ncbi:BTAD domain-containing putative transcriptional regulator [Saccharothrix sp. Mg75]|uniref:AfsR/SARP family transcriptional regulator n=1 Tax=Saccharothrix sp. Mg75 TaxID=3445357 RepID=UPI003EEE9A55